MKRAIIHRYTKFRGNLHLEEAGRITSLGVKWAFPLQAVVVVHAQQAWKPQMAHRWALCGGQGEGYEASNSPILVSARTALP